MACWTQSTRCAAPKRPAGRCLDVRRAHPRAGGGGCEHRWRYLARGGTEGQYRRRTGPAAPVAPARSWRADHARSGAHGQEGPPAVRDALRAAFRADTWRPRWSAGRRWAISNCNANATVALEEACDELPDLRQDDRRTLPPVLFQALRRCGSGQMAGRRITRCPRTIPRTSKPLDRSGQGSAHKPH